MVVKYLRLLQVGFSNLKEYKLDFFGDYLRIPIQISLLYVLWSLIFSISNKNSIGGFDFTFFLVYIGMATFISAALPSWVLAEKTANFVTSGNAVMILTKPVNFVAYVFSKEAADFLIKGIIGVVFFGVLASILNWHTPNLLNIFLFLISICLGLILQFFVVASVSFLCFFIYAIWGIRNLVETSRIFFSGEMIPLTLFPGWLMGIASILPFKYALFVPLLIYLEKYTLIESLEMMGLQVVFILIFIFICQFIYRKGLKRMDAQGG